MFNKKNIKYIVILCVCFVCTLVLLILSFMLGKFFHVTTVGSCTEGEAVISAPYSMDEQYCFVAVRDAKKYVEEEEEGEEETQPKEQEEPVPAVACTLRIERDDLLDGKETELKEGTRILFLSTAPESALTEGAVLEVAALRIFVDGGEKDVHVATLDLFNKEKNKKVRNTQIGMLCGVVVFFFGGGFCMLKLCGIGPQRVRW